MGLIDFVKAAGRKIGIGDDKDEKAEQAAAARARQAETKANTAAKEAAIDRAKAKKAADRAAQQEKQEEIMEFVKKFDFDVENLRVQLNDDVAVVTGKAATQVDKEKAILVVGNTEGIAKVDDRISVVDASKESRYHTVVKGDSLSKIAKAYYDDTMKYPEIFDANKPMLKDPDLIYPGQVLRIPPLD